MNENPKQYTNKNKPNAYIILCSRYLGVLIDY
jgi:hypothetical protein